MELRIEPASDEVYEQLRAWRYPPPYDFYDGDIDPPLNPLPVLITTNAGNSCVSAPSP